MKNLRIRIGVTPLILTSMVKKYINNLLFCILKKPPFSVMDHKVEIGFKS